MKDRLYHVITTVYLQTYNVIVIKLRRGICAIKREIRRIYIVDIQCKTQHEKPKGVQMNNTHNRTRNNRNKKKNDSIKVIFISWAVIAGLFLVIGLFIGRSTKGTEAYAQNHENETADEVTYQSAQIQIAGEEIELYGTYSPQITKETYTWESTYKEDFVLFDIELDEELQEFVYFMAQGYEIDYTLALAVMQTESDFRPGLISQTNDHGLMQINICNHEWLKNTLEVNDFLNPYENIRSGMYILRDLFEKYETPEKVLMAYNMGESGAQRLWNQNVYETNYTRNVLGNQKTFCDGLQN